MNRHCIALAIILGSWAASAQQVTPLRAAVGGAIDPPPRIVPKSTRRAVPSPISDEVRRSAACRHDIRAAVHAWGEDYANHLTQCQKASQ